MTSKRQPDDHVILQEQFDVLCDEVEFPLSNPNFYSGLFLVDCLCVSYTLIGIDKSTD